MMRAVPIISILLALCLAGCGPAAATPTPSAQLPSAAPATAPAAVQSPAPSSATIAPDGSAAAYADPFAYCAAVATIDSPDARYAGPAIPDIVAEGLRHAYNAADAPLDGFRQGSFWRCMNGQVYACTVGANLPCTAKADDNRTPTQPEIDFCRVSPNADAIPMVVTGRATIFEWRCSDGAPTIVRTIAKADTQGFIAGIWFRIAPDGSATPDET